MLEILLVQHWDSFLLAGVSCCQPPQWSLDATVLSCTIRDSGLLFYTYRPRRRCSLSSWSCGFHSRHICSIIAWWTLSGSVALVHPDPRWPSVSSYYLSPISSLDGPACKPKLMADGRTPSCRVSGPPSIQPFCVLVTLSAALPPINPTARLLLTLRALSFQRSSVIL